MTEDETRTLLNIVATNYKNFIKPETNKAALLMTWVHAFKDIPPDDAMQAVCSYIQRNKFPPVVADIFELLPYREDRSKYYIGEEEKLEHMKAMYAFLKKHGQEASDAR